MYMALIIKFYGDVDILRFQFLNNERVIMDQDDYK